MTDADNRPAVVGQVERPVRPGAEARWYCLDRDGLATLCKDEADAREQVIENDDCWPRRAPHRAALLGDVTLLMKRHALEIERLRERVFELEADPQGGDVIPLAQPRDSAERAVLAAQVNALRDALKKVLDAGEREAAATMSWQNARENFSDSNHERKAHERAMLAASDAEREARVLLATLKVLRA